MRTGAMVLGIIGGVVGLAVGILCLFGGALWYAVAPEAEGSSYAFLGLVACVFAVAALVGSALTKAKPVWAGVLMLVGGVGGFVAAWFWLFPGILLLIGGVLAIVGRKEGEEEKSS